MRDVVASLVPFRGKERGKWVKNQTSLSQAAPTSLFQVEKREIKVVDTDVKERKEGAQTLVDPRL